jgi:hypothetical protein
VPLSTEQLRHDLVYLLQEPDPKRPLDSLERVTVLAFLTGRGVAVPAPGTDSLPNTIEDWLTWVECCSPDS